MQEGFAPPTSLPGCTCVAVFTLLSTPVPQLFHTHYVPFPLHLSMSKAYGMMGWRIGYIAYHTGAIGTKEGRPSLSEQLLKVCVRGKGGAGLFLPSSTPFPPPPQVQDTTIICPPQLSQHVALAALSKEGSQYVAQQIAGLEGELCACTAEGVRKCEARVLDAAPWNFPRGH